MFFTQITVCVFWFFGSFTELIFPLFLYKPSGKCKAAYQHKESCLDSQFELCLYYRLLLF